MRRGTVSASVSPPFSAVSGALSGGLCVFIINILEAIFLKILIKMFLCLNRFLNTPDSLPSFCSPTASAREDLFSVAKGLGGGRCLISM